MAKKFEDLNNLTETEPARRDNSSSHVDAGGKQPFKVINGSRGQKDDAENHGLRDHNMDILLKAFKTYLDEKYGESSQEDEKEPAHPAFTTKKVYFADQIKLAAADNALICTPANVEVPSPEPQAIEKKGWTEHVTSSTRSHDHGQGHYRQERSRVEHEYCR